MLSADVWRITNQPPPTNSASITPKNPTMAKISIYSYLDISDLANYEEGDDFRTRARD